MFADASRARAADTQPFNTAVTSSRTAASSTGFGVGVATGVELVLGVWLLVGVGVVCSPGVLTLPFRFGEPVVPDVDEESRPNRNQYPPPRNATTISVASMVSTTTNAKFLGF